MLIARKFARDLPALLGLIIVLTAVIVAIAAPWLAPHPGDAVASHLLQRLKPPSAQFPFGTDNLGRDMLSRCLYGAQLSVIIGFCSAGLATLISVVIGIVAGAVCFWACTSLKHCFKYDDSLDVFGIHGVGGIVGALGTAIVAAPGLGGYGFLDDAGNYDIFSHFITQATAVIVAVVWSAVVAFVALLIVKAVMGLRVAESSESDGLDLSSHGEQAYN